MRLKRLSPLFPLCLLLLAAAANADEQPLTFKGLSYPLVLGADPTKSGGPGDETPYSEETGEEYDTVLIQGEMPDPASRIEALVRSGAFSLEKKIEPSELRRRPDGRFWARYKLRLTSRQPLRLRLVNRGATPGSEVTLYSVESFLRAQAAEQAPVSTFTYTADPALSVSTSAPFGLTYRQGWNARPPTLAFSTHTPEAITLHHTQGRAPATYEAARAEMTFIQQFHQEGRGWIDIGYHFLIDPQGNIFEGRPVGVIGAHVRNKNTGNTGISLMGNHHPPVSNPLTPAAEASFLSLARYLRGLYAVPRAAFKAHRDLQATDCPGDDLYAKMGYLRGLIFDPVVDLPPVPAPRPGGPLPPLRTLDQLDSLLR
jgi:hypothetical protein